MTTAWRYRRLASQMAGLVIACSLSGCKTAAPTTDTYQTQPAQPPCWLETPVTPSALGQVGVARSIAAGSKTPETISKLRALEALCHSQGDDCAQASLEQALEQGQLAGRPLSFATYTAAGYIYAYAGFGPASTEQCAPAACDLNQCNPAWLCTPSIEGKTAMMGVSYRATTVFDQYRAAVENALLQAEYLYGVEVTASKSLKTSHSEMGNYSFLYEANNIDAGKREALPYYLAHQCKNQSTLFTHIVIDRPLDQSSTADASDIGWIQNPKYKNVDGAVGAVERLMASGLASDQIKLAIERAAVQLAFEKNSTVSEDLVQVTFGKAGLIHISQIQENTRVDLKARVMQIHFEQPPGATLKVYAWVAVMQ